MFQYSNIIRLFEPDLLFPVPPVSKTMLVIQLVFRLGLAGHSKNLGTNEQHPVRTE